MSSWLPPTEPCGRSTLAPGLPATKCSACRLDCFIRTDLGAQHGEGLDERVHVIGGRAHRFGGLDCAAQGNAEPSRLVRERDRGCAKHLIRKRSVHRASAEISLEHER